MSVYKLDLKNLKCPLPVLKTQAFLKKLQSGDILEIDCTDPQTREDIPSFCRARGYEFVETIEENEVFSFKIKVKEGIDR